MGYIFSGKNYKRIQFKCVSPDIRKKVDGDFNKKLLHSVRGFGYMIKD